jgi:endonuclease YncB( thermonuclease family)
VRVLVVAIGLTCAAACAAGSDEAASPEDPRQTATVTRVIDGDTLDVTVDDREETVRLIGINAPESGECLADAATARLDELVGGEDVELERDVSDRDQFGRLLRYVSVDGLFVNEQIVADGLAIARRYPPDVARAGELEDAEDGARDDGLGIWNPEACGPAASAEVRIGQIMPDAPGDDAANLNEEWVMFENRGTDAVDLSGWAVRDESARNRYSFPDGFTIEPGQEVRLRSGCGDDSDTELHWCAMGAAVWNNDGDTVFLLDPSGNVAASRSY